jgi:hypothetical protein
VKESTMNSRVKGIVAAATATGGAVLRKALHRAPSGWAGGGAVDAKRWRVVTVNRSIEEVGQSLPKPLEDLGDAIEIQLSTAPGEKGTELAVRLRANGDRDDAPTVGDLRAALRQSKQLLEVGWVLEPDQNRTTEPTVLNAPLRKATGHAQEAGRL